MLGNKVYNANKSSFRNKLLSENTKYKINCFMIRPIVMYSCEIRTLKETEKQKLFVFKRKIVRKIIGRTSEQNNGLWGIKTNKEIYQLNKNK